MQPGAFQLARHRRKQHAVGSEREIVDARLDGEPLDENRKILAQQRLSAREPDLANAQIEKDVHQPIDLFEMEDVLLGQPDVFLLRHAVLAAEIAAVSDREPKVGQGTAQSVGEHACLDYRLLDGRRALPRCRLEPYWQNCA